MNAPPTAHDGESAWAAWMPTADIATRATKKSSWLSTLFSMVGGGAIGVFVVSHATSRDWTVLLALGLGLLLGGWMHILVHEAGHAVAGLARGMHLLAIGVGPFRGERTLAGWRWRKARAIAGIGGFAALAPAPGQRLSRSDQMFYLLGGPLANLLAALAAIVAFPRLSPALGIFMATFAGIGGLFFAVNLVPFRSAGWRTDGLALLQLWRRPRDSEALLRIQQLVGLSLAGVRPRDWPEQALPQLDTSLDPAVTLSAALMRLSWALDGEHWRVADDMARLLATAHGQAPDGARQSVAIMMASYAARRARCERLLGAWLPLSESSLLDLSAHRAWLQAELALLREKPTAAGDQVRQARAALGKVHDAASLQQLDEYLDRLEQRLGLS